jgi:hypothetical protein
MKKKLLIVDGNVCSALTRQNYFFDMLEFADQEKADVSIMMDISVALADPNPPYARFYKAISSAYQLYTAVYEKDDTGRNHTQAKCSVMMRTTLKAMDFVYESGEDDELEATIVTNNEVMSHLIDELRAFDVDVKVYTKSHAVEMRAKEAGCIVLTTSELPLVIKHTYNHNSVEPNFRPFHHNNAA